MIYLSRKEHFNAAHKLYNQNWSEKRNKDIFGVCSNKNWHGHNYEIIVTIKGDIDKDIGMVINLKILSKIIKEEILECADGKKGIDTPGYWELFAQFYYRDVNTTEYCRYYSREGHAFKTPGKVCLLVNGEWEVR